MVLHEGHIVAIFGGGVAGSEASLRLAERGIRSVVFEMDALPWGKIELGLPKWHIRQRDMEEAGIDQKIGHPLVDYVPLTKLWKGISFEEVRGWNFSALLLAIGAWKDRPLAIPGIEKYEGRGLYYQNPFVAWFNQYHDPAYGGPRMEIPDRAIVVGGGLASLDVVKIVMIESTLRALSDRGLKADLFDVEKRGIPHVLAELGIEWKVLGIEGCTLFYRRQAEDMPLVPLEGEISPEKLEKAKLVRRKLLSNLQSKFLFHFEPCSVAVGMVEDGQRLQGLIFQRTELVGGSVRAIPGSEYEVRSPLVIASIGSVPEAIPGIDMDRELMKVADEATGKLVDFENVFALGNAVTGRGNILASRVHGRQVSDHLMDHFLAWRPEDYQQLIQRTTAAQVEGIAEFLQEKRLRSRGELQTILDKVRELQRRVGYDGDYAAWVEAHRPVRLEDLKDRKK